MSLVTKTLNSALWVALRFFARQLVNTVLFFWLAAVLSPAELGVASLGVTVALFLLPVVSRGVRDALIQRPEIDDTLRNSAFTLNILLGVGLSILLAVFALFSDRIFGDPRMVSLTLLSSMIPLIVAIGNPIEAMWERRFQHKKIMVVYAISSLVAGVVTVGVALSTYPIWALVAYNITTFAIATVMFLAMDGWRPTSTGSRSEISRIGRFSAPIIVSQTITAGNQRIVEMIIGILVTPAGVAFFRFGGNFTRLLNQFCIAPVLQVLLPAFARSKNSAEWKLTRVLAINAAVSFFIFLVSATILPEFVVAVFGDKWPLQGPSPQSCALPFSQVCSGRSAIRCWSQRTKPSGPWPCPPPRWWSPRSM